MIPLPHSPYKGIMPYAEEDAPYFFGREAERELIIANLMASRLTLLYGPSGVGKSSLLRAGVAQRIREQARQQPGESGMPETAVVVYSSWRDDPIQGLAAQVGATVTRELRGQVIAPSLARRQSWSLADTLEAWTERLQGELVILLDQFEEYFLYHDLEDGAGTLATDLPQAIARPDLRVSFLVAVREDTLAKLDRFEGRIPGLFDNYLRIDPLTREAARAAIEGPLTEYNRAGLARGERASAVIEPALVDEVLDQVKVGRVQLGDLGRGAVSEALSSGENAGPEYIEAPYLQLVMTRLWDEEMARAVASGPGAMVVLRRETLHQLGGAERIVRAHLDSAMDALPAAQQGVAARAFHYLVTASGAKVSHSAADLADYAGVTEAELTPVLDELSGPSVRVLRPVAPPVQQPGAVRYEIFHDVLAPAMLDWRARYVQAEQVAAGDRQLTHARRRVRWLLTGLVGTSLALLAMVALTLFAVQQRESATRFSALAASRELAARAAAELVADPELSGLLALESAAVARTSETERALRAVLSYPGRAALRGHTGRVNAAVFSHDGHSLLTASGDATTRIWDVGSRRTVAELVGHTREVTSAAFSPDDQWIATASEDETTRIWNAVSGRLLTEVRGTRVATGSGAFSPDGSLLVTSGDLAGRVWDVATGDRVAELLGHRGVVTSAAFSPDGQWVLTASDDGTARIWDPRTGVSLVELRGHRGAVVSAEFSPDGTQVVTASTDATARVWDSQNGTLRVDLIGHAGALRGARFGPHGTLVVTAGREGTARIWAVATGRPLAELPGHTGGVNVARFSPDGRLLITAGDDGVARISEAASGRSLVELSGHVGSIRSVAFSPDGRLVVSAGDDGAVRLWEPSPPRPLHELRGHTSWITQAGFSPDGRHILTASLDDTARVWETNTGRTLAELRGHTGLVTGATFSPDGARVVTASDDRAARVWETATGREIAVLLGHQGVVNSARFSPDGSQVLTASSDRTARLWEAATARLLAELVGHDAGLNLAAFSPDGARVVTASLDGSARVWEATTGRLLATLAGHTREVTSTAFSPDGVRVVTGSEDGTARLWQADSGRLLVELRGHTGPVTSVAFGPDGRQVVTASEDHTARLWDAFSGRGIVELHGHQGGVQTAAFSPNGRWIATASDDGTARLWETATGRPLAELRGHALPVVSAVFSPDGRQVLTAGRDGLALHYACEPCGTLDELLPLVRNRVGRELTAEERRKYVSTGSLDTDAGGAR